jgi:hypothetical protein
MKIGNNIKKFEAKNEYLALNDTKLEKMIYSKEKFKSIYMVIFIFCIVLIILMLLHLLP